jgi:ribosomal protein S18 acetylase RimI-like enzyme
MIIRPLELSDLEPLLAMLKDSGQFDDHAIAYVRQTVDAYFSGETDDIWYSAEQQGFAGVAYCSSEAMADGVWNLLMLWVSPEHQRQTIGQTLVAQIEHSLKNQGARLLLVETSSLDNFAAARAFYFKQGFAEEGRIRNYYAAGEDKIIYVKNLA